LAAYPILPLDRLKNGVDDLRGRLEDTVLRICEELKLPAERRDDGAGVCTRCGRVAEIGCAVKSWVSYHGLFLNVAPALDLMRMVRPRSGERRISSLAASRERVTSMHQVRESFIRNFAAQFGYERYHVFTGHPLLHRTRRKIHVCA
jgi:lipoate-protein ligase B